MSSTGFDGYFADDNDSDDDHDSDDCIECRSVLALIEDGLHCATRMLIVDQAEFMALSVPEMDQLRMLGVRECLTELAQRGLAAVSVPCVRWRAIHGKDGQPFVFELHVTVFGARMLGFTEAAGDALELLISQRLLAERDV